MYIIKITKIPKGFMGKSTLSDSEYKMLAENLKLYYRKYTSEDLEDDLQAMDKNIIEENMNDISNDTY